MTDLTFTGERMVPGHTSPETFWEHVYRYRFAMRHAVGKRVLDIACGEGYGAAALLQSGAASVIGLDNSTETCAHARQKYGIDARVGEAEAIPLDSASVDVVVSFETIEHVRRPAVFLAECARVLAPGGLLIVSSPNKDVYARLDGPNPFHCSELTEEELLGMLAADFTCLSVWHQHPVWVASPSVLLLAADSTPWHGKIPGFRKLRKRLRGLFCRHTRTEPRATDAAALLEIIGRREAPWAHIANPYVLFPAAPAQAIPKYILIIARKK